MTRAHGGPGLTPALSTNRRSRNLWDPVCSTIKQWTDSKVLPCSPEIHSFWTGVLFIPLPHPQISSSLPAPFSQYQLPRTMPVSLLPTPAQADRALLREPRMAVNPLNPTPYHRTWTSPHTYRRHAGLPLLLWGESWRSHFPPVLVCASPPKPLLSPE